MISNPERNDTFTNFFCLSTFEIESIINFQLFAMKFSHKVSTFNSIHAMTQNLTKYIPIKRVSI